MRQAGRKTGARQAMRPEGAGRRAGKEAAYGKCCMVPDSGSVRLRPAALHKGREETREAAGAHVRRRPGGGAALVQAGAAGKLPAAGAA